MVALPLRLWAWFMCSQDLKHKSLDLVIANSALRKCRDARIVCESFQNHQGLE